MKRFAAIAFAVILTPALAQIPPSFEVVYLQVNRPFHRGPAINNLGHVVFAAARDSFDPSTADLFYYDGQSITQMTNDDVADAMPDINDLDEIVWCMEIGAGNTFEVMRMRGSATDRITVNSVHEYSPKINNAGQIVWNDWPRVGCANSVAAIYLYDDQNGARPIISDGLSNQSPVINELGEIAWTRYNFCDSPWTSEILAYFDGLVYVLTTGQREPQIPGISDSGQVAWYCYTPPPTGQDSIQVWEDGVTTTLTGWGSGLRMNGRGDIAFDRWYNGNQTWQVHLYLNDRFYQITNGPEWSYVEGINNLGEVVFVTGTPPYNTRIGVLRRVRGPSQLRSEAVEPSGPRRSSRQPDGGG